MSVARMVLLFSVLSLLLVGLGSIIGYLVGDFIVMLSIFFVIAIVINVVSYFKSDSIAIRMTRTKLIKREDNPRLYDMVKKVASEANIPMPRVGIMPSQSPNAFATGRNEKHAVVVATDSILSMLDDDELEAVIGHEINHITHKDVLVCTVAATIAMIISYIGNIVLFSELFGGMNNRNGNTNLLLLLSAILIPLGATFVQLGISRSRELDADIGSVNLVKKPDQLISSLKKISRPINANAHQRFGVQSPRPNSNAQSGAYSSLFIVNNFGSHALLSLFSTHPSLEKRIAAITKAKNDMHL
jgi:heat shock protein HtpX